MVILAINTASSQTGIALFKITKITKSSIENSQIKILASNSWTAQNNEAEKLMPAIARLLKKSSHNFSDIQQIYVIKGPGSFTGLRVGVTVANTLSYLNNCELFGLTAFEYWHTANDLPVLVYAGSGGVYISENSKSKAKLINLPDLNKKLHSKKIHTITGDISPSQITILKNIKFIKSQKTFSEIMQTVIEKNLKKSNLKAEKIIKPVYIKKPGITKSKKQLSCSTSSPLPSATSKT